MDKSAKAARHRPPCQSGTADPPLHAPPPAKSAPRSNRRTAKVSGGLSASFLASTFLAATAIKLLLIPGYRSTDFEVHRNWLAITHSLPVSQWYYEATSEWTLDYPPFFAWFEYALSQVARLFDPDMLVVSNLNYASPATVLFQRLSVMAMDVTLPIGLWVYFGRGASASSSTMVSKIAAVLVLLNPGLLIVDHIHFQYNGMLFGLLLIALGCFKRGCRSDCRTWTYAGALAFAALLNFKHIFLYVAPAVFVFLLSSFCCQDSRFHLLRFVGLGLTVLCTFALSLGPFISHLPQLAARLFPFKRGLCHAYWAPNVWALYSFADRALLAVLPRLGAVLPSAPASTTRGLVGDMQFGLLPTVLPVHTLVLTLVAQLPFLWRIWRTPSPRALVLGVVHCGFAAFAFGWHVHEKAVLTMVLPLMLVALESRVLSQVAYVLMVVSTYSLFPLLIDPADVPLRWGILAMAAGGSWALFTHHAHQQGKPGGFVLQSTVAFYLGGLFLVEWFVVFGHGFLLADRWAFLPLMMVSVYCAVGVLGCWFVLAWCGQDDREKHKAD